MDRSCEGAITDFYRIAFLWFLLYRGFLECQHKNETQFHNAELKIRQKKMHENGTAARIFVHFDWVHL